MSESVNMKELAKLTGTVIENHRIDYAIGMGNINAIFMATDIGEKRKVVLKRPLESDSLMVFPKIARTYQKLGHDCKNNEALLRVIKGGGIEYLVMEYIEGPTLADEIKRTGGYSIDKSLKVISDVLIGLIHASERGVRPPGNRIGRC